MGSSDPSVNSNSNQLNVSGALNRASEQPHPFRRLNVLAVVNAEATGDYRALTATGTSQTRRLLVGIRKVRIHPTRTGVSVTVTGLSVT